MSPLSAYTRATIPGQGKDSISNLYSIKIANKTTNEIPLTIKLENETGTIEIVGKALHYGCKRGPWVQEPFVVLPKKNIKATKNEITLWPLRRQ